MKPLSASPHLWAPVSIGLVSLPMLAERPLVGVAVAATAVGMAVLQWRTEVERREPMPEIAGTTYAPLALSIVWRSEAGPTPATRRHWKALLTHDHLWFCAMVPDRFAGSRDHIRIPRLDIVGVETTSESEIQIRFLDSEGRAQEMSVLGGEPVVELGRTLLAGTTHDAAHGL